ncbi:MAG TPA: ferrochelatase [Acidimicrobiales bacterium]|nr:ferrochelatase [Acidimicrobiales bacterium]
MTARTGLLVLSHGTPASREEVAPFYTAIRHGRAPSPEQLADLERRYDAIGGTSPLAERTADQVAGIARALRDRDGDRFVVEGATKYATPRIEDAVERLVDAGVADVIGLVLAPLRAPMSTDQYHDRAASALRARVPYHAVWSWWAAPGFAELLAVRVRDAVAACASDPLVVFSAHSLPVSALAAGTDYPGELRGAAAAVARSAGLRDHLVCWQSAGRTSDEWLGPDVLALLRQLDADVVHDVVVCPVGFVADHLEVLYDLDVEAAGVALARGIALHRTASLNDDPALCAILAAVVEGASP